MTSQKKPKKDSLCSRSSLFLLFLQRLGKENTMLPAYLQNQQQQPQNQPSPPPRITQQTQAPNPVHYPQLFQDSHVPPHLLQRSPLNANVPIAWNHSAYTSDPSIVRVPLQDPVRVSGRDAKRFGGKPRMKGPLSELASEPAPAPAASSSSAGAFNAEGYSTEIVIYVNGEKHVLTNPDPLLSLNEFIRSLPGHTGTKRMCNQGGCGCCTVLLAYTDGRGNKKQVSVNSCLRPVALCDGMSVTTIEGVGSTKTGLDPVQEAIVDHNGSQCGMCTPGFVMQMKDLLINNPKPTSEDVESHFDGNICRCTGYRPILDAFQTFAVDGEEKKTGEEKKKGCMRDIEDLSACSKLKHKQQQDPPRPLSLTSASSSDPTWTHPLDLSSLYSLIQTYPNSNKKLVVGNTTNGIWPDGDSVDMYIDVKDIPDLLLQASTGAGLTVGASVTLTTFLEMVEQRVSQGGSGVSGYAAVLPHLKRVASHQIRNAGCVAGNIMATRLHKNFPSDFILCSIAIGATLTYTDPMKSGNPATTIPIENIYQVDMTNKVIQSIFWPVAKTNEIVLTYKVALRKQFAHAIVNAGFRFQINPSTMRVETQPTIVYGGIEGQTVRCPQTEKMLINQIWTAPGLLQTTMDSLQQELTVDPSMGRDDYRTSLINCYFYKYYLHAIDVTQPGNLPNDLKSAAEPYIRPVSTGEENYDENPLDYVLPQFVPKLEGPLQATGEAIYNPDINIPANALHCAVVMSTQAEADIVAIDISGAMAVDGVVAVYTAADIPGLNRSDIAVGVAKPYQDPILADGHVDYYGQAVALVVAKTRDIALSSTSLVKVTYKNEQTPILTIDDAKAQNSVFQGVAPIGPITKGDVQQGLKDAPNTASGTVNMHDQYHFYMETQVCVVEPQEDQQFVLNFSTQWASVSQFILGKMLKLPASNFEIKIKRIGGSYGGKITRATQIGCLATLASHLTNAPTILQLDLQTNMQMVGKRHPYQMDYEIGYTDEGRVTTFNATYYAAGGFALEGTDMCLLSLVSSVDNAYNFDNFYAEGICLRTNLACNTFMRGPGYYQGIFFADQVMEHVAQLVGKNPDDVKRLNFYKKGDVTPYNQTLSYWSLTEIWDKLKITAEYDVRYKAVQAFNNNNKWKKRGIAMVPCKYGMLTSNDPFSALVSILADGSVVVSHGGTEVGQGINTKVAQAAAHILQVDVTRVRIATNTTITSANSATTGGSVTSELCVKAVTVACGKLRHRMNPIAQMLGGLDVPWVKIVDACIMNGVNLNATGSEWEVSQSVNPDKYNSYSVACAEVEIDVLTGEQNVTRVDILFDCGTSLNPIIDMGQVQGAFMTAVGYYLQELLTVDPKTGQVTSDDTWEYKPPMTFDVPIDFRVSLLKDAPNPSGILGSKATGEPPCCLGSVVFWATQRAILAARTDNKEALLMDTPATPDVVQLTCDVNTADFDY